MEIDIFLLLQSIAERGMREKFQAGIKFCQKAESLGFNCAWLGEHHFSNYSPLSRPLIYAAYIAANTTKIRIGTAALLLPVHHPLIVAEELATLDLLSSGRIEIGLSVSTEKFVTQRMGLKDIAIYDRYLEQIEIISVALKDGMAQHSGQFYDIKKSIINPRPIQTPTPPIWIVASDSKSIEYARYKGYGTLKRGGFDNTQDTNYFPQNDFQGAESYEFIKNAVQAIVYVAKDQNDSEDAIEYARRAIRFTLGLREGTSDSQVDHENYNTINFVLRSHALIGTAEQVIEKIRLGHSKFRIDRLICNFFFADLEESRVFDSINRFSKEVMPILRKI